MIYTSVSKVKEDNKVTRKLLLPVFLGVLALLAHSVALAATPSGNYWLTYSSIPEPPESYTSLAGTSPLHVAMIAMLEESTGEELAVAHFSKDSTFSTAANPNDTSNYRIELIKNADGKLVQIKLMSNAANNFVIRVHFNESKDNTAAFTGYIYSDDGVHAADGSVIPDPYADPELPIAGGKEMNFKGSYKEGGKFKDALEEAGYTTYSMRYSKSIYTVHFCEKLDSRAKAEQVALKPKGYSIDKEKNKGNLGYYSKSDNFTGKITIVWTFMNIPFTIEINDARLEKSEAEDDEINYILSGTAEIKEKSFHLGELVYKLKDKQRKPFRDEWGFKVVKEPRPSVRFDFVESWEYVNEKYGLPIAVGVNYTTRSSPTTFNNIPVKDLDDIDGAHTMTFMMPAFQGTATWDFEKEK